MGLSGEAILVWLDQVYAEPEKFVNDPALSRLALALLCPHHEKDVNRALGVLEQLARSKGRRRLCKIVRYARIRPI
jgi:hypothetical protein